MQLAFVHIPQMFSSYAAVLEDRSHVGENLFHCAQCRQEFKIPVRASVCAPTFVFCPNCAKPFRFGCSNDDNVWVPHGHIAPRSMSLRLDAYKDLVKLTVRGRGFLPSDHNHETGKYWIEQRYREEIRFDIKTRRTTWLCTVGGRQEMRLELCDPIEIPTFAANSILRYLYSHFSIRCSRAGCLRFCAHSGRPFRKNLKSGCGIKCRHSSARPVRRPGGSCFRLRILRIVSCSRTRRISRICGEV